ncbi:unnamed protein product [Gordionus sp. m RMFG-2023]
MLISPLYWISGLKQNIQNFTIYSAYLITLMWALRMLALCVTSFTISPLSKIVDKNTENTSILNKSSPLLRHNYPFENDKSTVNLNSALKISYYIIIILMIFFGASTGFIINLCNISQGYMNWSVKSAFKPDWDWPPLSPIGFVYRNLVRSELGAENYLKGAAFTNETNDCKTKWHISEYPVRVNGILIIKNMTVTKINECSKIDIYSYFFGSPTSTAQSYLESKKTIKEFSNKPRPTSNENETFWNFFYLTAFVFTCITIRIFRLMYLNTV